MTGQEIVEVVEKETGYNYEAYCADQDNIEQEVGYAYLLINDSGPTPDDEEVGPCGGAFSSSEDYWRYVDPTIFRK